MFSKPSRLSLYLSAELESEYNSKIAESSSTSDSTFQELDKDTQTQIHAITNGLPTKKKDAVDMLVSYVEAVDLTA